MMPEQVVMINWERHFLQNLSFLITILFFNILYIKVTSKKKNNYKKRVYQNRNFQTSILIYIIRKSKCSRISKRKVHFTKRNV